MSQREADNRRAANSQTLVARVHTQDGAVYPLNVVDAHRFGLAGVALQEPLSDLRKGERVEISVEVESEPAGVRLVSTLRSLSLVK